MHFIFITYYIILQHHTKVSKSS